MDSRLQEDSIRRILHFPCTPSCSSLRLRALLDPSMLPCAQDTSASASLPSMPYPHRMRTLSHASASHYISHRTIIIHRVFQQGIVLLRICSHSAPLPCPIHPHHFRNQYLHFRTSHHHHSTRAIDFAFIYALHHVTDWGQSVAKSVPDVGCAPSLGRYPPIFRPYADDPCMFRAFSRASGVSGTCSTVLHCSGALGIVCWTLGLCSQDYWTFVLGFPELFCRTFTHPERRRLGNRPREFRKSSDHFRKLFGSDSHPTCHSSEVYWCVPYPFLTISASLAALAPPLDIY